MASKDRWNADKPARRQAATPSTSPHRSWRRLLPVLYPGVFPNLAAYTKPRADLLAILLTGIPEGVVPGFQNYTGPVQADLLRLNVAVPPSSSPNPLGPGRRRRGRLPERPPGDRRRGDRRAAGDRRADHPAGGPGLHARRRGQRRSRTAPTNTNPPFLDHVPVPGHAGRRLSPRACRGTCRMTSWDATSARKEQRVDAGQGSVLLDIGGDIGAARRRHAGRARGRRGRDQPARPAWSSTTDHPGDHHHDSTTRSRSASPPRCRRRPAGAERGWSIPWSSRN